MNLHELAQDNAPTERCKIVIPADKRPANGHVRHYNASSCSDFVALIPGNDNVTIGGRKARGGQRGREWSLEQSERYPHILLPPELCPTRFQWHKRMASWIAIRSRRNTKEARTFDDLQLGHFSALGEFSAGISGCTVFQHYLVDQFCKMEAEIISYFLQNIQAVFINDLDPELARDSKISLTSQIGQTFGQRSWI